MCIRSHVAPVNRENSRCAPLFVDWISRSVLSHLVCEVVSKEKLGKSKCAGWQENGRLANLAPRWLKGRLEGELSGTKYNKVPTYLILMYLGSTTLHDAQHFDMVGFGTGIPRPMHPT